MDSADAKNIAEAAALGTAALYFIVKFGLGYLVVNMGIEIKTIRTRRDMEMDYLVVNVTLNKGDRDGVLLKDLNVKVSDGVTHRDVSLEAIKVHGRNRTVRMAPGESSTFAYWCLVPPQAVCDIEVAIEGYSGFTGAWFWNRSFWKASAVSLPSSPSSI